MKKEQKPKATVADFEKRVRLNAELKAGWTSEAEADFLEIMNSIDWDTELIQQEGKC